MGETIIFLVFIGVLGIGAWLVEGVFSRRPEKPETIADAQSTSERGLW